MIPNETLLIIIALVILYIYTTVYDTNNKINKNFNLVFGFILGILLSGIFMIKNNDEVVVGGSVWERIKNVFARKPSQLPTPPPPTPPSQPDKQNYQGHLNEITAIIKSSPNKPDARRNITDYMNSNKLFDDEGFYNFGDEKEGVKYAFKQYKYSKKKDRTQFVASLIDSIAEINNITMTNTAIEVTKSNKDVNGMYDELMSMLNGNYVIEQDRLDHIKNYLIANDLLNNNEFTIKLKSEFKDENNNNTDITYLITDYNTNKNIETFVYALYRTYYG